jgi:hypothetical protein
MSTSGTRYFRRPGGLVFTMLAVVAELERTLNAGRVRCGGPHREQN